MAGRAPGRSEEVTVSGRRREPRTTSFPRTARVNEVLREVIADSLERWADSDERLGLLTVTAVDTTPDLQRAVVYVASLSDEAAAALVSRRAELQRRVARQVRMKRTPHLEFAPDPAVAHGWRVEQILRHLGRTESGSQDAVGAEVRGPHDAADDSRDERGRHR